MHGIMWIPFAVFAVLFCLVIYKIISTWHKDNKSPRITVPAIFFNG